LAWTFILSASVGSVQTYDEESTTAVGATAPVKEEIDIDILRKFFNF